MSEARQLTMDGRDVPVVWPLPRPQLLTGGQRAIIHHLSEHGSIRSIEAGTIIHVSSHGVGHRADARRRYASADGLEALKRLEARGLVVRDPATRGRWLLP